MTDLTAAMDNVAKVITTHRYVFRSEADLQQRLTDLLRAHGAWVYREVQLNSRDRIDLVVNPDHVAGVDMLLRDGIGIELKVAGSSAAAVRQLTRYARSPVVAGLLLVTTRAHTGIPTSLSAKPVRVVSLLGNGLA